MAKKIILTITSSLVGCLLIATIILACTHYTAYSISCKKAFSVEVYKSGYTEITNSYLSDSDVFNNIIEKADASTKENNLSALFQNVRKFDAKVENNEIGVQSFVNSVCEAGSYMVAFYFTDSQTLIFDGKEYVNENSKTKETVKYNQLWLEVKNSANYTEYVAYLVDSNLDSTRSKSYFQVRMIGQQADLYSYVADVK